MNETSPAWSPPRPTKTLNPIRALLLPVVALALVTAGCQRPQEAQQTSPESGPSTPRAREPASSTGKARPAQGGGEAPGGARPSRPPRRGEAAPGALPGALGAPSSPGGAGVPARTRPRLGSSTGGTLPRALDLPLAAGVTHLTMEQAKRLPYVSVPVSRIVKRARTSCRTHYYGLYLQSKKMGWARMGCEVARRGGKTVLVQHSRMVMQAQMYQTRIKMEANTEARYATTGRGELLYYLYTQQGMQQKKRMELVRRADGWHLTKTYEAGAVSKPPERRLIKRVESDLQHGEAALSTLLIEGRFTPGDSYRYREFDSEEARDQDGAMQLLATGTRVLRGVPVKLNKLEIIELRRRIRGVTLVDEQGNWLDGTLQGTIRIRREERALAKKVDPKAGDFGLGVVIQVRHHIPKPGQVKKMKLVLEGYLPAGLTETPRHTVEKRGVREAAITIRKESLEDLPAVRLPVTGPRFKDELKATSSIEARHPAIRALARRAAGGERRALEAAKKINSFVFSYLKKSLSTNLDSALAIAKGRQGDCTEHARLMTALCRAIGLPAREVGGVTYVPELRGFGYHAWVEVWVGRWISVDPAWNEVPANATHIRLGGPDDVEWVGTLGALKAEVLEVETR